MHVHHSFFVGLVLFAMVHVGCARGRNVPHDAARPDGGGGFVDAAHDGGRILPDTGTNFPDTGMSPVDTGVQPDANVMRPDTGPHDAMIARDTGSDAGGCTSAAACSDGIACNGIERCESGRCVAGVAMTCDDGVACTVDMCVEPGTCAYTPNDAACSPGQTCTATGCRTTTGCAESPCRLTPPQCGCGAGMGCYVEGATRVCAAAGVGTAGSSCTTNAQCAAEYECVNFSRGATPASMCSHMCATDAACGGGLCIYTLDDGTGATVPGLTLCSRPCDPVNQTGCATGLLCTIFQESAGAMRTFTDCTGPAGFGTQYTPCSADDDCAAGFACIDGGFGPECSHWCRYPGGSCPSGATCTGFATPVTIGGVQYGVCI